MILPPPSSLQTPAPLSLGSIPPAAAARRAGELARAGLTVPAPTGGIDLYRIAYRSTGAGGEPRTLTGLLAVPQRGATRGIVLYFHGTTADRGASPSRYTGAARGVGSNAEAEVAAIAFAGGGYALAMPDELGLGDDPGVHPYPLARLNARSGLDMVGAAKGATRGAKADAPLYVAGYSEGGAVAMWAVREMEAAGAPPTAAAPMSGPYDLSGVTARSLLRGGDGLGNLGARLFLLGYAAYSAKSRLPELDLRSYFAPSMASYVPFVFAKEGPDAAKGKRLVIKALQLGASRSIVGVTTARLRDVLRGGIADDPLFAELRRNDTYSWAPRTRMLLPFLTRDALVPPENTTHALASMRARGVGPGTVRAYAITSPRYAHGSAAAPAIAAARAFFDGGFAAIPGPGAPAPSTPGTIAGTVVVPGRATLPPGSRITVRLRDDSEGGTPLAEATIPGTGGRTAYRLTFDPNVVLPSHRYGVAATIDGPATAAGVGPHLYATGAPRVVREGSPFGAFDLALARVDPGTGESRR